MLGLPYTIHDIAQLVSALDLFQGMLKPNVLKYVVFDSREINHGMETIFVAIKTQHRDGHDFIEDAYQKGVRNFILDRKISLTEINYILVSNTLEALQMWAMQHRKRFTYPVIGITGSNGKTIIKEWLATMLEMQFQLVKSPMSYNSQLGVPISLLRMHPQADLAIIEAGISTAGEMEILAELIDPTIGVLTRMGEAHKDGFENEQEKLKEKCLLFTSAQLVIAGINPWWVKDYVGAQSFSLKTIGTETTDDLILHESKESTSGWEVTIHELDKAHQLQIPIAGRAALENALLCVLIARHLGLSMSDIRTRLHLLYPVAMRTEIITDNPSITIINDTYNSDPDSIRQAFRLIAQNQVHPSKKIVLSDILHLGEQQIDVQKEILQEAIGIVGSENVYTIGPIFKQLREKQSFEDIVDFTQAFDYASFRDHTVLLKGARPFRLEELIPYLNPKLNASFLQIDLAALEHNFRLLKAAVPPGTKAMCMVKAAAYGSGTWEIAQTLEKVGADYLAVAYASEAIELRKAGIQLPIMVMNADESSLLSLLQHDIEPEIYSLSFLEKFIRQARLFAKPPYKIHLKFETGMGRLGLNEAELDDLIDTISSFPDLQVISVMSHLAAADDPEEDAFTQRQIASFIHICQQLQNELGLSCFRHILNTAGLLRFPQYAFEMVRMGIGLYGVSPVEDMPTSLKEIGKLASVVSHLQIYPEGVSIGYGRSQKTVRPTLIATIPIGYADGIPIRLGNGNFAFLIRGKRVPTFGRICMDMLMLDVTDVDDVVIGDEVVIFGKQADQYITVNEIADVLETIPYEVLVRISSRVRRVFVRE